MDAVALDHLARQILRGVGDHRDPGHRGRQPSPLEPDERERARNVERGSCGRRRVATDLKRRVSHEVPRDHLQRRVAVRGRDAGGHRGDVPGARRVRRGRGRGGRVRTGGEGLQPAATATTVRVRDGERMLTDGPYAETKEQLGGYYLLECKDLDDALQLGRADPGGQDRRDRGAPGHGLRGDAAAEPAAPQNVLVDRLFRRESGQAVAILARILGDLDRAEEAVQDAFLTALERWPERGLPDNPAAWIVTAARNRALDRIRSERRWAGRRVALEAELRALGRRRRGDAELVSPIPDERLRLIFTTCHPALAAEARVGAHAARARRADDRRGRARVPGRPSRRWRSGSCAPSARSPPPASATRSRATPTCRRGCDSVLATVYLVFNAGYGPPVRAGAVRRGDPARPPARRADARRGRGDRAAGADAPARLAPRRARGRRRPARAARRPGPLALGRARRSPRARRSSRAAGGSAGSART